ncbi:hypothetical protein ABFX02_03G086700 [Erythranthe guttata]
MNPTIFSKIILIKRICINFLHKMPLQFVNSKLYFRSKIWQRGELNLHFAQRQAIFSAEQKVSKFMKLCTKVNTTKIEMMKLTQKIKLKMTLKKRIINKKALRSHSF